MTFRLSTRGLVSLAVLLAACVLGATPARAACLDSITVTSNADTDDTSDPGYAGSIRKALVDVCAGGTITFDGDHTIALNSTLNVNKNVTIDGAPYRVELDGQNQVRIMSIDLANVTLNGLTLKNGKADLTYGDSRLGGGVISSGGTLTVTNSSFSANTAEYGGGIFCNDGALFIGNSTFSTNTAKDQGGGVFAIKTALVITDSTFLDNVCEGSGGGVYATRGTLSITSSSFSNNTALLGAGVLSEIGPLLVANSSFANNTAVQGGGLYNLSSTSTITNSTFFANTALGGQAAQGGGVYNNGSPLSITNSTFSTNDSVIGGGVANGSGTVSITNSILANNTNGNCSGEIDGSHNLVFGDTASCGGSPVNANPYLGSLASNGGRTQTMALLAGSAAIDAGDPTVCAAGPVDGLDQRGVPRPTGHCSIGAYEVAANIMVSDMDSTDTVANGTGQADFGTTALGVPISKTFIVKNHIHNDGTGLAELMLSEPISIPSGFSLANSFGKTTLAGGLAGDSTTFVVTLSAIVAGDFNGTVSFAHDQANQPPFTFTIRGRVCPSGSYRNGAGGCETCATCSPSSSADHPYGQFQSQACTATTDTVCSDCREGCLDGTYESQACDGIHDRACTPCTTCPASQYETTACQADGIPTQNRTCSDCTVCSANQYQSTACQAGGLAAQDRVCSQCSGTCPRGQFLSAACSDQADRQCTPCSLLCPLGTLLAKPCTATADRVCRDILDPLEPPKPVVDAGVDTHHEPDAQPDALASADTQTTGPSDTDAPIPDTMSIDAQSATTPETATVPMLLDAWMASDVVTAEPDTQADTADSARDSLLADATRADFGSVQWDTRPADTQTADSAAASENSGGCTCNLSRGTHRDLGAVTLLLIGLALAGRRRANRR